MMNTLQQHLDAAWEFVRANNEKLAMDCAKQAHALAPESPDVAHLLGLLASRDGNPSIALPLLQKSIDIGGITERRLRDMAEALFSAGHAEQALIPLNEAIQAYGESDALLGLRSAIEIDLNAFNNAQSSAKKAYQLNPNNLAWELNYSFSSLMQMQLETGFKHATARDDNLTAGGRCPVAMFTKPSTIWLTGEQGIGDTLYYLRYVPALAALGWQFHLQVDRKLVPLLENHQCFVTVKANNPCPTNEFWLNVGDLALMAIQCGIDKIPEPLPLSPDVKRVEKIKQEMAKLGPAPYIAVTWRGGPKGRKQQKGVRMLDKRIEPAALGKAMRDIEGTIINLQRQPIVADTIDFTEAVGRKVHDYTALNNNLAGMLAMLSVVDAYVTVSNTNLHLREGLAKPSHVFVNRPFQDWRWLADGDESPWYPNSRVYRADESQSWQPALVSLQKNLKELPVDHLIVNDALDAASSHASPQDTTLESIQADTDAQIIATGWDYLKDDVSLAIQQAQLVLNRQPDHPRALHLLGWAAVHDHQYDVGAQVLAQAANSAVTDGIIWRDYIRCLTLNEQVEEALKVAEVCLNDEAVRTKSAIHYAKAGIYFKVGNELAALEHYDECRAISPNNMDALSYAGMVRMKLGEGHASLGFKQYSARPQASQPHQFDVWCCPVLKGDIKDLEILITYDMGLGDELTYLRYMPWLIKSGAKITYWCGAKLYPILARLNWPITLIPDTQKRPDTTNYSLAFIVNELPAAVEHLGAPEIAPPLPLSPNPALVEKWQNWLAKRGDGPFVGINWRAGVAKADVTVSFSKLAKAVPADSLGQALNTVNVKWVSLQRNVTQKELNEFSTALDTELIDAAGVSDDLDDMLALMSVLDGNVGVSNTNMHLRASLGLGSDVLVQNPGGDWRWGIDGQQSVWFEESTVYRQAKTGEWNQAFDALNTHFIEKFGVKKGSQPNFKSVASTKETKLLTHKLIWVTAGHIEENQSGYYSSLQSAQERVINPAKALESHGWSSVFINEKLAEAMGGWQGQNPQHGDIVIFSKVVTPHALKLIEDAHARGAYTIADVFNDFSGQIKREQHQQQLMQAANAIVSVKSLKQKWDDTQNEIMAYIESYVSQADINALTNSWHSLLSNMPTITDTQQQIIQSKDQDTKRVLVGMMYSGENEYEQAKAALLKQSHQNFELLEVKNLPNKQAHDTLYARFMEKADDFDYFLKLDADMVLANENVLAEMVQTIQEKKSAHLFAYVKDCPSDLMIPGIQMFRSDTQWLGSDEQLNVDYLPKVNGEATNILDKDWIQHMPDPSNKQLFGYGVHKALKAIQPAQAKKNQRNALTHINILAGIARNAHVNTQLNYALLGATIVFDGQFNSLEYHGDLASSLFNKLEDRSFYKALCKTSSAFWRNEIQLYYRWLDTFKADVVIKPTATQIQTKPVDKNAPESLIWLTAGNFDTSQGFINSNLASTRYRVILPAANLGPLGYQSQVVNEKDLTEHGWGNFEIAQGSTLIVSKSLSPKSLNYIVQAKTAGCRIIADFCDNHFERNDALGAHHNEILALADIVTTCSTELQKVIEAKTTASVIHITDSFEGSKQTAHFSPSHEVRLLWFGSHTNIDTLAPLLKALAAFASSNKQVHIDIVTYHPNGVEWAEKLSTDVLTVNYIPWSKPNFDQALRTCDIVVIPTLADDHKQVKSPNRMVESLWAGRYVVAGNLPAYTPFNDYASIGDDLIEGIKWAINNPKNVVDKVKAGQKYISENHTPKLIGEKWHEVLLMLKNTKQYNRSTIAPETASVDDKADYPLAEYCQTKEIIRVLKLRQVDLATKCASAYYFDHYPIKHQVKTDKVAVYTAIFGGYDTAPILNHVDPNIDYILYTDNASFNAPKPWQVRVVPAMFVDPQVDARRIKVLSHQFLADFDLTVWIDGNFTLEKLTIPLIADIASRAPIALCKHQFRNCIYDEAGEILRREIDASTPVQKQLSFYKGRNFPSQFGLHATSFLVRNHHNSDTQTMNIRWWELLSQHSKRDQLSFDYVRWESNINVMTLPYNLRENDLYFWGKNGERKHKVSTRRSDEHHGRALNIDGEVQYYNASDEHWSSEFIQALKQLNTTLKTSSPECKHSVLYEAGTKLEHYQLPDVRLGAVQRACKTLFDGAQNILFFGFDGGHLPLMALHYSNANCIIAENNLSQYQQTGIDFLKTHSKRIQHTPLETLARIGSIVFDVIFIHSEALKVLDKISELNAALNLMIEEAKVITLDSNNALVTLGRYDPNSEQAHIAYHNNQKYMKSMYGVWLKDRKEDLTWRFAIIGKYGKFYSDFLSHQDESIFIDIGANVGLYSLLAEKNDNIQAIYSFEPHPETFQHLKDNIAYNGANKCHAYELAVADQNKSETIHTNSNHSGIATLRDVDASEAYDSTFTIDCIDANKLSMLIKNPSTLPISVKIDVEGLELIVIKTLVKTSFWPQVTNIYYEVDSDYLDYQQVETILVAEGFKFEAKNGNGKHFDLLFTKAHSE